VRSGGFQTNPLWPAGNLQAQKQRNRRFETTASWINVSHQRFNLIFSKMKLFLNL
jgi:hypothetical protein